MVSELRLLLAKDSFLSPLRLANDEGREVSALFERMSEFRDMSVAKCAREGDVSELCEAMRALRV